jgi:hypothetical protein
VLLLRLLTPRMGWARTWLMWLVLWLRTKCLSIPPAIVVLSVLLVRMELLQKG